MAAETAAVAFEPWRFQVPKPSAGGAWNFDVEISGVWASGSKNERPETPTWAKLVPMAKDVRDMSFMLPDHSLQAVEDRTWCLLL